MGDEAVRYFAYGAMMSPAVVKRRAIPIVSAETAVVEDHALVFDIAGVWIVEPAFASIVPSPGEKVHGVLYTMSPAAMARLDAYEGPEYRSIEVDATGAASGAVSARTYKTIAPVEGILPSRRYLRVLCEAARARELPSAYVERLEAHPSAYVPVLSPIAELMLGLGERMSRRANERRSVQMKSDDTTTP